MARELYVSHAPAKQRAANAGGLKIAKPHLNPHIERMKHRAVKALQMLSPYEKQLLEDHVIEGVTLERLGREQNLDRRTIRKRINRAIARLREAEKDLP